MYENNNTVSIDWKSLFIKVAIVAVLVFIIFKGYEIFTNRENGNKNTTTTATQLFNANLESLRQAGENYYDYSNYPAEGQTVMTTLSELLTKGDIKELYDENGNECNRENSYVSLTNDGGQYKLKATLTCGGTSNYTVVQIGCECEGDECTQAIKKLQQDQNDSKSSSKSSSSKSSNSSSSKSSSSKSSVSYNNSFNNVNSNNTNSNNDNTGSNNNERSTQVVDMSDGQTTTKRRKTTTTYRRTTTRRTTYYNQTTTTRKYTVYFDSNGGSSVSNQYVERYDTAYRPSNPYKRNARFIGWYYNGRLFDFNTPITSDITLEAYYWETKTITKQVYSAGWGNYGTSYFTVTHKLRIPSELQNNSNIKNVKIVSVGNARSMYSQSDLVSYRNLHTSTFDGYKYSVWDNYSTNPNYLARMYNIRVSKENSYEYDRWVVWSGNVAEQCRSTFTINGETGKCDYGIVYNVVWQYDVIS